MTTKLIEKNVIVKGYILSELYPMSIYADKILRPHHQVNYSAEFPKSKKPSLLEQFANVDDVQLKKASLKTLEGQANKLIIESERLQQTLDHVCPPVTDLAHVEKSEFTVTDLYNDIVSRMEWSCLSYVSLLNVFGFNALKTYHIVLSWGYYRAERKKWRKCRYKYCLDMFAIKGDNFRGQPAKRSDSRYCCESCRKDAHEAEERFKIHGSFLPIYYYTDQLTNTVGDKIRAFEEATPILKIERQRAKGKATSPMKARLGEGYKGGKITEYKSLEEAKNAYETAENGGRIRI